MRFFHWILPIMAIYGLLSCAFSEFGRTVIQERQEVIDLEEEYQKTELQYLIVLNNLEKYPDDPYLNSERDKVKMELQSIQFKLHERRQILDNSLKRWEEIIIEQNLEKKISDDAIEEGRWIQEQN